MNAQRISMRSQRKTMFGALVFLILLVYNVNVIEGGGSESLSYDFYQQSCPQVEDIVRAGLQSIALIDPTTSSALLRLMFHDCQVQGCDASILIDSDNGTPEIYSGKNFGIRKRKAIGILKSMVEVECPQQVSCADIIVLAAREAVALSLGPRIAVRLGRRDSATARTDKDADASLPRPDVGVDGMLKTFADKGMTIEESVAIVGGHTLGITHCLNVNLGRLGVDGERPPGVKMSLSLRCPLGTLTQNTSFVLNDPTSLIFDNLFYKNAMIGRGALRIDAEMPTDPRTAPYVQHFAANQGEFFRAFSSAFVKLSSHGVLTGEQGMIRKRCNAIS